MVIESRRTSCGNLDDGQRLTESRLRYSHVFESFSCGQSPLRQGCTGTPEGGSVTPRVAPVCSRRAVADRMRSQFGSLVFNVILVTLTWYSPSALPPYPCSAASPAPAAVGRRDSVHSRRSRRRRRTPCSPSVLVVCGRNSSMAASRCRESSRAIASETT